MAKAKWMGQLSTTEPFNHLGLMKVRSGNKNSETFEFQVSENNLPYNLKGLDVLFCTAFDPQTIIEKKAEIVDIKKGIIRFTMDDDCTQVRGTHRAYFELYKDGEKLDTTQDFEYTVTWSILKRLMNGESYIHRLEEFLEWFAEYKHDSKIRFDEWFNEIKDILGTDIAGSLALQIKNILDALFYCTPEQFGAIGDGIVNDTEAIQMALDYAVENDRPIYFKTKTYLISSTLVLPGDKMKIIGNGAIILTNGDFTALSRIGKFKDSEITGLSIRTTSDTSLSDGLLFDIGNTWLENNVFSQVNIKGFENGLRIKMGLDTSTGSGVVYNSFNNCVFNDNHNLGVLVDQSDVNTGCWFNHNTFKDCQFSYNKGGFYIGYVSTQNLLFINPSFEGNGRSLTTEFEFAFAFRGERVISVNFISPYDENNSPYKIATAEEILEFNLSTELSVAGNKKIGDFELFNDYHNWGIRPLTELDSKKFGDFIICSDKIFPTVKFDGGIYSLGVRTFVLNSAGNLEVTNAKVFQGSRRPSSTYQSLITNNDQTTNAKQIVLKGLRYTKDEVTYGELFENKGIIGNSTMLDGTFNKESLFKKISVNTGSILGTNTIYVDSVVGNDYNLGVFERYPVKSLGRAIQKAVLIQGNTIIKFNGHFNIDSVLNIGRGRIKFIGSGPSTSSVTARQIGETDGYLYFDIENTYLSFENTTIHLVKPANSSAFTFNFMINTFGECTIGFKNVVLNANSKDCSLLKNKNDTIVEFEGCSFSGGGSVFRGYIDNPTVKCQVIGFTDWDWPRVVGPTSQRPAVRYLSRGYKYYDITSVRHISWDGVGWRDYNGVPI